MKIAVTQPTGADLLASKIRQVNTVLRAGGHRAKLEVPDWYQIALAVRFRDTVLLEDTEPKNGG